MFCAFLDRLTRQFDRKIHLIADRHTAHRSAQVKRWLAHHQGQIELHFLPSYAPELNPDELVNADLKRTLPAGHTARNAYELAAQIRTFFRRRQNQPDRIRDYFRAPHVR